MIITSIKKGGKNPPFSVSDFKILYPQFFDDEKSLVPLEILEMYIRFAHSHIKKRRLRNSWGICMGLFIAHFITLYLGAEQSNGNIKGLISTKTVDGASISYDHSQTMQDFEGFGNFKTTMYGTQLITIMKMYSKGCMLYV